MWDRRPLRSKLIVTLAAPPSRTVPSPSWPSHSLALGNLPARFCISARDTSLHLCSARRNIVSVRVMNGFTCLIDFDRKKFDVKVVVGRVVEKRGPVLPSHVSNRGGDLNITGGCRSRLGNQLSSSAPVIATVFTLLPGSTSIEQVDAQLLSVGLRDWMDHQL